MFSEFLYFSFDSRFISNCFNTLLASLPFGNPFNTTSFHAFVFDFREKTHQAIPSRKSILDIYQPALRIKPNPASRNSPMSGVLK